MLLHKFTSDMPVMLEGEGSMSSRSFQVGAMVGASKVTSVEATSVGVIVRREGAFRDLLITGTGAGEILEKVKPEPAQLQDARRK